MYSFPGTLIDLSKLRDERGNPCTLNITVSSRRDNLLMYLWYSVTRTQLEVIFSSLCHREEVLHLPAPSVLAHLNSPLGGNFARTQSILLDFLFIKK